MYMPGGCNKRQNLGYSCVIMETKRLSDMPQEALTAVHTREKSAQTYDRHSSKPFVSFNQASSVKSFREGHFRFLNLLSSGSRVLGTLHIIKTWHLCNPIHRCGKHSIQTSPVKQKTKNVLMFSSENTVRSIIFTLAACEIKRFFFLLSGQANLCSCV